MGIIRQFFKISSKISTLTVLVRIFHAKRILITATSEYGYFLQEFLCVWFKL